MKKIIKSRWAIPLLILFTVVLNYAVSYFRVRVDLTAENRYTLSRATSKMLMNLEEPVDITVFLKGEFPAGFKKLANSTNDLLRNFKEYGKSNFRYRFVNPVEDLDDSARLALIDTLSMFGFHPTNVKAQARRGEGEEQRLVYPGALIRYKDRIAVVDLLQGLSSIDGINALNSAEALLEYKFAGTIEKIARDQVPAIAYATGNGEPYDYSVDGIWKALGNDYFVDTLNIQELPWIPDDVAVLLIVKPTKAFTDDDKLKIDQFVMRGGRVMWFIDQLNAEYDSLSRSQADFIAFDRGLNLQDLLFRYGARINPDLVQDLQSDKIPLVVGSTGGKPQMQLIPFPYFVLLNGASNHATSRNLDKILSYFPSSVDTVAEAGIKKTVVLHTSVNARRLETPAMVSLNSVKNEEDLNTFNKSNIPVGVLLEGKFRSLYANRISKAMVDSLNRIKRPFMAEGEQESAMLLVADGDLVLNRVSRQEGPLPMGMNPFTQYPFANKEFFLNAIEYLTSTSGILETRSKDFVLRLLDAKKVEEEKGTWQFFTIVLPALLISLGILLYQWLRKRKYN